MVRRHTYRGPEDEGFASFYCSLFPSRGIYPQLGAQSTYDASQHSVGVPSVSEAPDAPNLATWLTGLGDSRLDLVSSRNHSVISCWRSAGVLVGSPGSRHDDCNYGGLNSMPEVLLWCAAASLGACAWGKTSERRSMEATNQEDQKQPLFQLCKATDAPNPG